MLTISLHGIRLHAKIGLYPEEKITGNDFEIDVDVFVDSNCNDTLPFIDYAIAYQIIADAFREEGDLLETFVKAIHTAIKTQFTQASRVRVTIRKLRPPLGAEVKYSQVCYEA